MLFLDRTDAGRRLAQALAHYRGRRDVVVLGLPRGGVPVAAEVAGALGAPLDVLVVRKLGVPGQPELAIGAIASGGLRYVNSRIVALTGLQASEIEAIVRVESQELERRERRYRAGWPPLDVAGKSIIVVDDGLATGATMIAATDALRMLHPARIVVAVPTAPSQTIDTLRSHADEIVCLDQPEPYFGVGQWYQDFRQIGDDEVVALLSGTNRRSDAVDIPHSGNATDQGR